MNYFSVSRVLCAAALLFVSTFVARAGEIHDLLINDSTNTLKYLATNSAAINERDTNQYTPLHYAAQYDRTNAVKWLLKHKADVNAVAYDAYTPLHLATSGPIAKLLISYGANCKLKDSWGRTPLQHAAQLQHFEAAKAMLDAGCPLDLTAALMLGMRDDAKKIIRRKPEQVKQVAPDFDMWGNTSPLGVAAGNGDIEMVGLLLKAGAPVNAATTKPGGAQMTPLCNAVWGGHYEVAALLCQAGADCNVTGGKFDPHIVDFARKHSDARMVDLLVRYGAKLSP